MQRWGMVVLGDWLLVLWILSRLWIILHGDMEFGNFKVINSSYTYGIFQQQIVDGYQQEFPDYWLSFGNAWEIQRLDVSYDVKFRGHVIRHELDDGKESYSWESSEKVVAVAYDYPIPGYGTHNTINIRLWSSKPVKEFDLASFNAGNYDKSVEEQKAAENITSVLYPNDNHYSGKE